jgi:hypothetical protein
MTTAQKILATFVLLVLIGAVGSKPMVDDPAPILTNSCRMLCGASVFGTLFTLIYMVWAQ